MTNETIKAAFSVAMSNIDGDAKKLQEEYKVRHDSLQERLKYMQEILPLMNNALADIIQRCKQKPPADAIQSCESELVLFMQSLLRMQQASNEEILKIRGSLAALENVLQIYANSYARFDSEISRARDIQSKQAAGDLEGPRKIGERPVKLKDIRNYSEKTDK